MEAFFHGLLQAFNWQNALSIIFSSNTIQRTLGKSILLNGVIYLGGLALVEAFYGSPNHKVYGVSYANLTGYPFYLVCLLANARLFSKIARVAHQQQLHKNTGDRQVRTATDSVRTIVLYSNCAILVFAVRSIPYAGHAAGFFFNCIIMAYYCFEYKWMYFEWTMDECMACTEEHWTYFLGFGLPATTLTFFLSTLRSGAVFALIYPIFVIMASTAAPITARKHSSQRLPVFLPIRKMNNIVLTALHFICGARIETAFRTTTDTMKKRPNKKRGKKRSNGGQDLGADTQVEHTSGDADRQESLSSGPVIDQHFSAAHYGELNEEMLGYFKSVESNLDNPSFESVEDQRLFVDNVYNEVDGNELRLATNYSCSLILEKLLKISSPVQLRVFTDKISGKAVELFVHRFASHVCQTLLTLAANVVEKEAMDGSAEMPPSSGEEDMGELLSMEQLILDMCDDIKPVVKGLMSQQFASHVIRTLLFVLAGKRIDDAGNANSQLRSKRSAQYKKENDNTVKVSTATSVIRHVPKSFKAMCRTLTTELAMHSSEKDLRELALHRVANPVLQLLLELQDDDKEGKEVKTVLIDRILWGIVSDDPTKKEGRDAWFETLVNDPVGSHLLEVIFKVAPDKIYSKVYKTFLRNKLEKFSLQPVSNFVIQNLISNARKKRQLDSMVGELSDTFEKLIKKGKHGVIRHILDAVVRLNSSEEKTVTSLASALHMSTPEDKKEFVNCAIRLWSLEDWLKASDEEKQSPRHFHIQGSLIIQSIAKMSAEHNSIVVDSFLSQPADVIQRFCFTPVGSRAFESILTSPNINAEMKKKIMRNLEGHFVQLAMDKFGSHIIDHCWSVADIDSKERIADELAQRQRDLSEHYIGKCVMWKCRIEQYWRRYDDWVEREKGIERKMDMFKDILGDDAAGPNKRRRNA